MKTLLPFNASNLEKNLEQSIARAFDLPVPINSLWHPETCPENLLPWLAWALSIDTWDSDWPVETKRTFIAQSVLVHQQKGTLSSIERVLSGLGVTVDIAEWFETGSPPHTFQLTAWANKNTTPDVEPILGPSLYRNLVRVVDTVKPVRSHYDFRVGAAFATAMNMNMVVFRATFTQLMLTPRVDTTVSAPIKLASASRIVSLVRVRLQA